MTHRNSACNRQKEGGVLFRGREMLRSMETVLRAAPARVAAVFPLPGTAGKGKRFHHQPMWWPPLMSRLEPVIHAAWSSTRKPTA